MAQVSRLKSHISRLSFVLILFLSSLSSFATAKNANEKSLSIILKLPGDSIAHDSTVVKIILDTTQQVAITSEKDLQKEKVIAAILAFPVPFGILGLHRIYLGTDPWVPVIYIITFGGGCGVLPLIDFLEIVFASDEQMKSYEHNSKIFMWVN